MGRMTLIAAPVEAAHIGDRRVGPLGLDLERRNQGILGPDYDPIPPALDSDADGELRLHRNDSCWPFKPSQNGVLWH